MDIEKSLLSKKIRIVKINRSENAHHYVERCFKDFSQVSKFHYNNQNNGDSCYFGCIIEKTPIYLFIDKGRNKIVIYNTKESGTVDVSKVNYEAVKKLLLDSKSATHYLKRNGVIKCIHKVIWFVLMAMCICLLTAYCRNIFDDGRFGTVALNIVVVMAIQDCINVYLLRFDRKGYDKWTAILVICEGFALVAGLGTLFIPGTYATIGRCNNILSVILTFATIFLKFDKPRDD